MKRIFHRESLRKEEILRGRKRSSEVFLQGEKLFHYPVLLYYQITEYKRPSPVRVAFSVSKKRFKKAVDRNRIKRRMREAYRKIKHPLLHFAEENKIGIDIMLVYVGKEMADYATISDSLLLSLRQLGEKARKE